MQGWLEKWTPVSIEAARTMQPIWSQPAEKAIGSRSRWSARAALRTTCSPDIGLETPKEA
jgi:propane monooxygenase small subunit